MYILKNNYLLYKQYVNNLSKHNSEIYSTFRCQIKCTDKGQVKEITK